MKLTPEQQQTLSTAQSDAILSSLAGDLAEAAVAKARIAGSLRVADHRAQILEEENAALRNQVQELQASLAERTPPKPEP